jgi:hypothetical protein
MHCNNSSYRGHNNRLYFPGVVDSQHGPLPQLPQVYVLLFSVSTLSLPLAPPFLHPPILSQLSYDTGRFFLVTLAIVCMAELLAVAMPTEGIAVMFLGIIVPVFTLFAGFLLPRTSIPGWWIWAYWGSLLQYCLPFHFPFSLPLPLPLLSLSLLFPSFSFPFYRNILILRQLCRRSDCHRAVLKSDVPLLRWASNPY